MNNDVRHCSKYVLEQKINRYLAVVTASLYHGPIQVGEVKHQLKIVGNQVLFAFKSSNPKILSLLLYRLNCEFETRFAHGFNVVFCEPKACLQRIDHDTFFDLFPLEYGVDYNYSVAQWTVFGKSYTIRYLRGVYTDVGLGDSHLFKLHRFGLPLKGEVGWGEYKSFYEKAYDITPLEGCIRDVCCYNRY